jgi:hypothetical protein
MHIKPMYGEGMHDPVWPDWAAAIFTFASSFALALVGVVKPVLVQNLTIPSLLFGFIGMWLAKFAPRTGVGTASNA